MATIFYYLSGSPFSWKVWLSLEHKAIPYDPRVLSVDAGELKHPDFLAINPRGKVPAIVDGDFALHESAAIVDYLEDRHPGSGEPLWPADIRIRAVARRIAAEADAYVYPHVRQLMVELIMRKDGAPDEQAIAEARSALTRELAALESIVQGPFLAGAMPCAADFTLYPFLAVLGRVAGRRPEYGLSELVGPRVRGWMSAVEVLPYFAKTSPPHWRNA